MYRGLRTQGPGNREREGAEGALMSAAGSSQEGDCDTGGHGLVDQPEAPSWLLCGQLGQQEALRLFQGVPRGAGG